MPLRLLLYITEVYKSIVKLKALYDKKVRKIPTPEFFVFYNGKDSYPEKKVLRLSDAFTATIETPSLELSVSVYNVNKGHNVELLEQSPALSDYATFVACVKEYLAEGESLDTAIDKAIHYCIENGIMRLYLENDSDEVRRILTTEWNEEVYREVLLEEGREEGVVLGEARARWNGLERGRFYITFIHSSV